MADSLVMWSLMVGDILLDLAQTILWKRVIQPFSPGSGRRPAHT